MPEESSPVCPNHQREMLFDLLSEQYICPECQEERREAIRNARAQSPFTPEEAFPGHPEYARSLREKYMTKAFSEAWNLLKALPEQQQYTDLPVLDEGFGVSTPQHRVGTVHPAIIGMLERHRNATQYDARGNPVGLPPKNMRAPAVLRTTGTSPSNPPLPRMIEAHPGRSGRPNLSGELYSGDYGQSPQFLTSLPAFRGVPNNEKGIVAGRLESQVPYPFASGNQTPKGTQQALIDSLYTKDPEAAARMFE